MARHDLLVVGTSAGGLGVLSQQLAQAARAKGDLLGAERFEDQSQVAEHCCQVIQTYLLNEHAAQPQPGQDVRGGQPGPRASGPSGIAP